MTDADGRDGLPPGPELPAAVQGVCFARDPTGVLLRGRARYGPVFTLRFPTLGPVVVVSAPDHVQQLVVADPDSAHAGEARRAVLPQASPVSSFGADEQAHTAARARISPSMARERVDGLEDEIRALAARHIDECPVGRPFRVLSRMRTLCEEIFVRLVLGVETQARSTAIVAALGRLLRTPGNPPLLPPDRDQGVLGGLVDRLFDRRVAPLTALLTAEIDARRSGTASKHGIIAHAIGADPSLDTRRIVEELIVVLAAAQEPPSIALTWLVERLSREPRLREDFLSRDRRFRMAVFDETLRLRPPALACLRRLTADREVHGHRLSAGNDVMLPIPLIHRDPDVFADPDEFRAERFLDPPPPQFIPFGDGTRGCPGEDLARASMLAIVPLICERLRLRFPGRPERPVQRATVLVPNRSGLAVARPGHG